MQEWLRLQAAGELTGPAALWMRTLAAGRGAVRHAGRSVSDPELAADPAHRATLERMRAAVAEWMTRIGDQGLINEPEMIQRMWPGGVQPAPRSPTSCRARPPTPARARPCSRVGPTGGGHLRADAGRVDRVHDREARRRVAALHRPVRVEPDDAARQGDPIRIQGERGNARLSTEPASSQPEFLPRDVS